MKLNLIKIKKRERSRDRGFMNRMKEAWDDMYKDSTMSTETLRDNGARFRKGNLLFKLIKVRDGNDLEVEVIQIRATEPIKILENFEENEENEEESMENNNKEEDEETRFARLGFEEILHTLTASAKGNIEDKETESS